MKNYTKTDRQKIGMDQYNSNKLSWKISLQYSKVLYKNINKHDVLNSLESIYNQYIKSLKSLDLINKNKSYMHIWTTLINTYNNPKLSDDFKISCIKQLYYVNLKKNKIYIIL